MKRILKNRRGDTYFDTVVLVVAAVMVIVLAINIFSFLALKQDLDYYAKEMVEVSCAYGKTGGEVQDRNEELAEQLGLDAEVSFEGTDYFNASKRTVQYGEPVNVTVTYRTYVKGLGAFRIPVTLTAKHSGLSRIYWK